MFFLCELLHAQGFCEVQVRKKPPNWQGQQRVDIAMLPRTNADGRGWLGVCEVKYFTRTHQREWIRQELIKDFARVASVDTSNLNAKFVVASFVGDRFKVVFDKPHAKANLEHQRLTLRSLTDGATLKARSVRHSQLSTAFPSYQNNIPPNARFDTGLRASLLARSTFTDIGGDAGTVCVWQVNKRQGKPA